jgi:hypothetical protein
MKITYVGTHTGGVYLPGDVYVEHGQAVDVDQPLADDLLSRVEDGTPQWVAAKASKSTPAPSAPEES